MGRRREGAVIPRQRGGRAVRGYLPAAHMGQHSERMGYSPIPQRKPSARSSCTTNVMAKTFGADKTGFPLHSRRRREDRPLRSVALSHRGFPTRHPARRAGQGPGPFPVPSRPAPGQTRPRRRPPTHQAHGRPGTGERGSAAPQRPRRGPGPPPHPAGLAGPGRAGPPAAAGESETDRSGPPRKGEEGNGASVGGTGTAEEAAEGDRSRRHPTWQSLAQGPCLCLPSCKRAHKGGRD